jgi:hypothetical protein
MNPMKALLALLGTPAFSKPAQRIPTGLVGATLRYDHPRHSIHCQMGSDDSGIEMITLMTHAATPGRRQLH